jgi:cytoplasmic iron level regulating protein YaaA (DUF328/UPF0246 family)
MTHDYIILLPPSEGKSDSIDLKNPSWDAVRNDSKYIHFSELNKKRLELIKSLQKYAKNADEKELEALFELKGKNLDKAAAATKNLLVSPTMPAYRLYTGVVYDNIEIDTLSKSALTNLTSKTYAISGLWGLVRLSDHLPDYKLKISSRFDDINLVKYWMGDVSRLINQISKEKFVWDLLPNEHRKVWNDKCSAATHIAAVRFVEEKAGKLKVVGHTAKAYKGKLVREIVSHDIDSMDKFKSHRFENMKIIDIITKGNKSEVVMRIG